MMMTMKMVMVVMMMMVVMMPTLPMMMVIVMMITVIMMMVVVMVMMVMIMMMAVIIMEMRYYSPDLAETSSLTGLNLCMFVSLISSHQGTWKALIISFNRRSRRW